MQADWFNLPAVKNSFEFDNLNFYEDYASVAWTSCTNWVESWTGVLEYENKMCFYDEVFVLFYESTGDECSYSAFGSCTYADGAASFSNTVSCSCSVVVAYKSSYDISTYLLCHVTTDLVGCRVWDQGQINKGRLGWSRSRCL